MCVCVCVCVKERERERERERKKEQSEEKVLPLAFTVCKSFNITQSYCLMIHLTFNWLLHTKDVVSKRRWSRQVTHRVRGGEKDKKKKEKEPPHQKHTHKDTHSTTGSRPFQVHSSKGPMESGYPLCLSNFCHMSKVHTEGHIKCKKTKGHSLVI